MDNLLRIKIGGVGGQGVQFFSKLLIDAAFRQGLNVTATSFYEPASTGGLTVADVIIAPRDTEIIFPFVEAPEILICFAQRAWDEFKYLANSKCVILADSDYVHDFSGEEVKKAKLHFHLPFYAKAVELGSEKLGNIVVLGFLSEMLDFADHYVPAILQDINPEDAENLELLEVDAQNFEDTLVKSSPEKFREMNINAFKAGYQISLDIDYPKETSLQHPES
jgi:2-oxoglutarate ferredoxin oxidoreductase subunit gamma